MVKWGTMNIEQLHLMKYDPYTETSNGIDYSQKLQLITGVRPKE